MMIARTLIVFVALAPFAGCGAGATRNETDELQSLVKEQSKTIESLQTRVSEIDSIMRGYGMTKDGLTMNVRSLSVIDSQNSARMKFDANHPKNELVFIDGRAILKVVDDQLVFSVGTLAVYDERYPQIGATISANDQQTTVFLTGKDKTAILLRTGSDLAKNGSLLMLTGQQDSAKVQMAASNLAAIS
jgi:hypothetical protein